MMNYNKMSKKHDNEVEEFVPQHIDVIPAVEESTPAPVIVDGVVYGCDQLYVRSEASVDSEPLGIIKRDTKVRIFEVESTNDFYSVCTETGLEGFCMKKFITVL